MSKRCGVAERVQTPAHTLDHMALPAEKLLLRLTCNGFPFRFCIWIFSPGPIGGVGRWAMGRMEDAAVSLTGEASTESGQHSSGYSVVP